MTINSIGENNIYYEDYFSKKNDQPLISLQKQTKSENLNKIGRYWINETDFDSLANLDYTTVLNRAQSLRNYYKFKNYFTGVLVDRRV